MAQQSEKARLTDLSQEPARFSTQRIQKRASKASFHRITVFFFLLQFFLLIFFSLITSFLAYLRHWLILVAEILSFSHYYFSVACQK